MDFVIREFAPRTHIGLVQHDDGRHYWTAMDELATIKTPLRYLEILSSFKRLVHQLVEEKKLNIV